MRFKSSIEFCGGLGAGNPSMYILRSGMDILLSAAWKNGESCDVLLRIFHKTPLSSALILNP